MNNNNFFLGLDTSAYTTSIAILDSKGNIIVDYRKMLKVDKGKKGLRQQEAVFQHINNLPELIEKISKKIDLSKIRVVSSSIKPRNVENSYMPVFKISQTQGYIISKLLNCEYKEFSHQDGHIGAGLFSVGKKFDDFIALHISGGTTELLKVKDTKQSYNIEIIGGTKDISAGQLVDRIGVKLGYSFPCGTELDKISLKDSSDNIKYPVSTKDTWINFSGTETFFAKLIEEGNCSEENIAKSLFMSIGYSLEKIIINAVLQFKIKDVIIIGGVASNSIIRDILIKNISNKEIANVYFPDSKYCTDNAVGIAFLGTYKEGIKEANK